MGEEWEEGKLLGLLEDRKVINDMKVNELKKKYEALQAEGNDIYKQMKPLLRKLKSLSKKCLALYDKIDGDKDLYATETIDYVDENGSKKSRKMTYAADWNDFVLFRLSDFEFLVNDKNNPAIDAIDNVLFNLKHTKI